MTSPPANPRGSRGALPVGMAVEDARWRDAIRSTVWLWCFALLLYLPLIIQSHAGEGAGSTLLDCSTIVVSMGLGLTVFAVYRQSLRLRLAARLPLVVLTVVGVTVVQTAFDLVFTEWVTRHVMSGWASLPRNLSGNYVKLTRYLTWFGMNAALFQLAASRRAGLRQERRLAAILSSGQQAELEALRFRFNPHFLFNTLNAISAMIVTQRGEEADEMVERLSAFLRASYAYDPNRPITVEEEFAAVEHYARIEQIRFRDRLSVTMDFDDAAAGVMMPALIVQPLVESAVELTMAQPGVRIEVAITATVDAGVLRIAVAHDGPARGLDGHAAFATVRRRLAALYGDRAGVSEGTRDGPAGATLWLPANGGQEVRRMAEVTAR